MAEGGLTRSYRGFQLCGTLGLRYWAQDGIHTPTISFCPGSGRRWCHNAGASIPHVHPARVPVIVSQPSHHSTTRALRIRYGHPAPCQARAPPCPQAVSKPRRCDDCTQHHDSAAGRYFCVWYTAAIAVRVERKETATGGQGLKYSPHLLHSCQCCGGECVPHPSSPRPRRVLPPLWRGSGHLCCCWYCGCCVWNCCCGNCPPCCCPCSCSCCCPGCCWASCCSPPCNGCWPCTVSQWQYLAMNSSWRRLSTAPRRCCRTYKPYALHKRRIPSKRP